MFGDVSISSYASLWKVGGAVDKKVQSADSIAHESAVTHFRDSLKVMQRQGGDGGHQQMLDEMLHCIERLERLLLDHRRFNMHKEDKVSCTPCPVLCAYACMYGCVCLYFCTYICMNVCIYTCVFVPVYVCLRACMSVCMCVCMYICLYACMHVCMYPCMYVCLYVCMYICMYVWG